MQSFIFNGNQSADQNAKQRQDAIVKALMRPASNMGEGMSQLGIGLASGFQKQGQAFPAAPGGAKPGFGMLLQGMFGGNKGGGMY